MVPPVVDVLSTSLSSLVKSRIDSLSTFHFPQAGDAVVAINELTKASASLTRHSSRLRSQALVSSQSSSATTSSPPTHTLAPSIAFSSPPTQLESTAPPQTLTPPSLALNSTMSEYQAKRWLRQEARKQKRQQTERNRNYSTHVRNAKEVRVGEDYAETPLSDWIPASSNMRQGRNDSEKRRRVEKDGLRQIPFESGSESVVGRTLEGDVLFVRADSPNGFTRRGVNSFARFVLGHQDLEKVSKKEEGRGDHGSIILGVTRSYEKAPFLCNVEIHYPELHTKYPQFVQEVVKHSNLSDICKHVSKVFETHFPRIAARYKAAGSKSPLPSLFGLFPMLCINVPSSGGVDCNLHVDYKNPAGGICAVIPFGEFDSSKHYWLVLNELGVVVELPAGVVLLFPSALIQHGNYHIVSAPTITEAQRGSGIPRGSIVLFGQANWVNFLELGATMTELKNAKVDTYDYGFDQLFRQ
ncbi:hypothetical protein JCM5353_003011 [Sporobolomyces roseus]